MFIYDWMLWANLYCKIHLWVLTLRQVSKDLPSYIPEKSWRRTDMKLDIVPTHPSLLVYANLPLGVWNRASWRPKNTLRKGSVSTTTKLIELMPPPPPPPPPMHRALKTNLNSATPLRAPPTRIRADFETSVLRVFIRRPRQLDNNLVRIYCNT